MRHAWDDGEWFMGTVISTCAVCGGVRVRDRVVGLDYINAAGFHLDMVGRTRKGWTYSDTPRSCPGLEETRKSEWEQEMQS